MATLNGLLHLKISSPPLIAGSDAPSFTAKDLDGKTAYLTYSDVEVPTVLYIFTPDCHWCAQNRENIESLFNSASGQFRFVGVSLTNKDLHAYLSQTKLPFQVFHSPPDNVAVLYGLTSTPSTLVISPRGKVVQYWRGAYTEDLKSEIEDFFQVKLPGVIKE